MEKKNALILSRFENDYTFFLICLVLKKSGYRIRSRYEFSYVLTLFLSCTLYSSSDLNYRAVIVSLEKKCES